MESSSDPRDGSLFSFTKEFLCFFLVIKICSFHMFLSYFKSLIYAGTLMFYFVFLMFFLNGNFPRYLFSAELLQNCTLIYNSCSHLKSIVVPVSCNPKRFLWLLKRGFIGWMQVFHLMTICFVPVHWRRWPSRGPFKSLVWDDRRKIFQVFYAPAIMPFMAKKHQLHPKSREREV